MSFAKISNSWRLYSCLPWHSFSYKSPHLLPFEFCRHTLSNEIRSFYLIWRLTDWTSPLEINFFLPSPSFNLRTFNFKHFEWEASCSDLGKTFAVIYRQGRILSPFEIREMLHAHTRSRIPSIGSRLHTNESVTLWNAVSVTLHTTENVTLCCSADRQVRTTEQGIAKHHQASQIIADQSI